MSVELIDACFTCAKRSAQLTGWNPAHFAAILFETFQTVSKKPLIYYYASLTIRSNLQTLQTQHSFDEATRLALLSRHENTILNRKTYIVEKLSEFLKYVDPALISSTHSSNPVGTGGISDKLSERIRTILPHTNESDEDFLYRTLTFQWIDKTSRGILEKHWDKRGIQIMGALGSDTI